MVIEVKEVKKLVMVTTCIATTMECGIHTRK
jgi:hypothetical protein